MLNVNAVPSNVREPVPPPFNVSNSTPDVDNNTVPSAVNTVAKGTPAVPSTDNVAPFATFKTVDAKRPLPLSTNIPAFTLVEPVYVFTPLNVNVPAPFFTNDPSVTPFAITPPKTPSLKLNVVPPSVTNPPDAPFNVKNSTPAADNANVPLAVTTAPAGNTPPGTTLNVAPEATPTTSELNLPLNTNVPAFTLVEPV